MREQYIKLSWILVLLMIIDSISTDIALSCGATELNPIVSILVENMGTIGVYVKNLPVIIVIYIVYKKKKYDKVTILMIKALVGIYLMVDAINLTQLLMHI